MSACIFDPIGFLTPFTIRVKHLFQELWERGIGWDDQLPPDLAKEPVVLRTATAPPCGDSQVVSH